LKKVELASFSTPPALGLIFTETNTVMDGNGLAAGQVVVALDGYGVQNRSQFGFVWGLSEPTKATRQLIVWDGHSYREVTAKLPGGILGARFEDYHR